MEELLYLIIELSHTIKYGTWANKRKFSDENKLKQVLFVEGENAFYYKRLVIQKLQTLLIKGDGIPTFAYFEESKKNWYKIYVLNSEKKFYCRLKNIYIERTAPSNIFYVKIN